MRQKGRADNKGGFTKTKVCLHMSAIIILYFLTQSFSNLAIQIGKVGDSVPFWYLCLSTFSVFTSVFLYAKHIWKRKLPEVYFGKPYLVQGWGIAAVVMPMGMVILYLLCSGGILEWGGLSQERQLLVLYAEVCGALRVSLAEGMLFWGLGLGIFCQKLGKRRGILLSMFSYALASLLSHMIYFEGAELFWLALSAWIRGTAFILITCETGSIWSSVWIETIYNIFFVNSQILTINNEAIDYGIWNYTLEKETWFWTGIPGLNDLETAGIVLLAFLLTGGLAGYLIKRRECNDRPY